MPTVAEQLRTAREEKKLSVNEVADTTKIRTDHIRALEAGDFNVFTAPVYIRGFVRCYATLLKLDVPQVMRTLDGELGQTEKFAEPPPLSEQQRKGALDFVMLQLSRLNWRTGLIVLGAIVVLLIVWSVVSNSKKRQTEAPKVPAAVYKSGKQSGETLPLPRPAPPKK